MSKIYIENSRFMEYIDELATQMVELTYGEAAAVVTTGPVKFEAGSKLQIISGKFLIK